MNQLMSNTNKSSIVDEDSTSFLLDLRESDPQGELNISRASIEDLSNLIVKEMISSVKDDLKDIAKKGKAKNGKK